jgi:hypothetical protein
MKKMILFDSSWILKRIDPVETLEPVLNDSPPWWIPWQNPRPFAALYGGS